MGRVSFICCFGCTKRHELCHALCPDYIKAQEEWAKQKKAIDKKRKAAHDLDGYTYETKCRVAKARRLPGKK